ncbi:unnamed protein product [Prorocentrum cordatum]|uniref:DUF218 domain-containing protein n=1 Tax=Prorocentrum cordatum TaxID=2364126 RepID=A0ABN9T0R3_9DINO|nr:unnamed protein product [Polarella glacialis]
MARADPPGRTGHDDPEPGVERQGLLPRRGRAAGGPGPPRGRLAVLAVLSVALVAGVASVAARRGAAPPPGPERAALGATVGLLDWGHMAKVPPWLSSIEEGAEKAVAIVLGQSLKPDGTASQLLVDRATKAKELLDNGTVEALIVSGGDPKGTGHTEASAMAKVLTDLGIPKEKIILESQAFTTAENAWFALRWIPKGTGQFYIVTSEFHMPRARYTIDAVFSHFYRMVEETYKDDPSWKDKARRYPRLTIREVPTASFCGNSSSNLDGNLTDGWTPIKGDVSDLSLARRAADEFWYIGSKRVDDDLFGRSEQQMLWPVQIDVTQDPDNTANFNSALAAAMNVHRALCVCTSPPEGKGSEVDYPLRLPASTQFPDGVQADDWERVRSSCEPR